MTLDSAPAASSAAISRPPAGQLVGGRFEVGGSTTQDALGAVSEATDTKTGKAIALRILPMKALGGAEGARRLKDECRRAAKLKHRSIVATYGVGKLGQDSQFVACEWVDGAPLSELVAKRREAGGRLSLRGAYNVIAHVCRALEYAKDPGGTMHGGLRPSVVWVTRSGRVKVSDFGVARAVIGQSGTAALGAGEQACLAPEVKAGGEPDGRSDIFGVGAILYEMLTARSPADGFIPPSQAHPDATAELDGVLLKCLAADPDARYASPTEVQQALLPLVALAPRVPAEEDFGIDVDLDVDLASQPPPAGARPPVPVPPTSGRPSSPGAAPRVGSRVSIHEEFRPSLAGAPTSASPGARPPSRVSDVGLKDLLARITENDAPRWMVVKDKLDHGPFSGRELVEMVLAGEVLADHGLLNMDTGERKRVAGFPEFAEFLEEYRLKQEAQAHQEALEHSETVEKVSNLAKFVIAAAVIGILGLGVGAFLLTRQTAEEDAGGDLDARADLFERGEIEITGTAGILPPPARRHGARRHASSAGGGSASGTSYEEAMSKAVNLGDATRGGGERQLTSADVAGVMNRHINSMFGCVSRELRSGGRLSSVQIDLAISGDGRVQGSTVHQGSPAFKRCITGRVRGVRFPSFPAPRMGARYRFSVD